MFSNEVTSIFPGNIIEFAFLKFGPFILIFCPISAGLGIILTLFTSRPCLDSISSLHAARKIVPEINKKI